MTDRLKIATIRLFKASLRPTVLLGLSGLSMLILIRVIFLLYAAPRTYSLEEAPVRSVAIVFGAGLLKDGSAGPILRDRVETAVKLYESGKVVILLMSGDNRIAEHNEPEAMRQYAASLGVPDKDIILDYAGRRTYDSCYRAKSIFQVESAILVTQPFHMARALFLCNSFGVESIGVEAENQTFRKISRLYWNTRELFATTQAVWDVKVAKPLPVLGAPEPIIVDTE